jgi:hypothetical protein
MNEADEKRLREDLETIRQAAGISLRFDRLDVWLALACAPAGAMLAAWSAFGPPGHWRLGIAPLLFLFLAYSVRESRRFREDPSSRKERTYQAIVGTILAVGVIGYLLTLKMLGFSLELAAPTVVFVLGLLSVAIGLSSRARRVALAGAVAVPFGAAGVFLKGPAIGIVGGLFVMFFGVAAALIMTAQLRSSAALHESTSH